jgi:PAS domain S-box-containing protein
VNAGELFVRLATQRVHPTALLHLGAELCVVWANAAATTRLGTGSGTLRGSLPDEEYAALAGVCHGIIAADRIHEGESDGLLYTITPIGDGYIALESQPRDKRFDMLFSQHVDGVFFMTLDEPIQWGTGDREALLDYAFDHLRITAINDAMCKQLGSTRERLIGSVPSGRWEAADRASWREHMSQLYDQGAVHHTLRAAPVGGRTNWVEGAYVCTYDSRGRITGHYGTQRDVTEERLTASALVRSQERLALAIEYAEIGVWDYDTTTRQVQHDPGWVTHLGYDITTTPWTEPAWWMSKMHPADYPEFERAFRAHLKGEAPLLRVEHRLRAANGDWLWLLTTGKCSERGPDGRVLRILGTILDITERKQLQERLAASERMASIGTLAAGVGHEINNPLTYIMLNLELLAREMQSGSPRLDRMRTMVAQTRYGTERVRTVVRDLQALTRAPEDRTTRIDLAPVLERCLEIAHHQIKHRAQLVRDLRPIPAVLGNEGRMVQLFLNLIVNAAQAIPEGHAERNEIRIVTSTAGDGRAVVEITDTGTGISPEHVSRVFDPFFTTKPVGEGTGLGLAICRTIVLSMNGDIEVDTSRSTTFRVRLPAASPPVEISAPLAKPGAARRHSVLVIDDEPQVGTLLTRVLPEHAITAETSARAALLRLGRGERFDHILCDLMMPDLTGMDFYDALALIDPSLQRRVIFISAGAFTDRARTFLERVKNLRLDKPFDVAELTAVLSS